MENRDYFCKMRIRRGKEMVVLAVLCVSMTLLFLLFLVVGIVWSLADCVVRKCYGSRPVRP